jgi:L-lysine exporter family protein LysE/ArgO
MATLVEASTLLHGDASTGGVLAFGMGFALGFLSSVPALGPLALAIIGAALENERKRAALLALSGALAECLWAGVAVVGVGHLVLARPHLLTALRLAAAGVILAFAISLFRSASPERSDTVLPARRAGAVFLFGFLAVAANPGFLATWTGFATLLVGPDGKTYSPAWAVIAGALLGILSWFAVLFALVVRFRRALSAGWLRAGTRIIAALLVVAAASLLFSGLRGW